MMGGLEGKAKAFTGGKGMAKIKVLDLATEVGMEDDKLVRKLKRMGLKVKDKKVAEPEKVSSPSDEKIIERDSAKEVVEKRVKPTVIRRRTRTLEPKAEIPPPPPPEIEIPVPPLAVPEPARAAEKTALEARAEAEVQAPKQKVKAEEKEEAKKDERKEEKPPVRPALTG
jgi:translation initiation factor IF-2